MKILYYSVWESYQDKLQDCAIKAAISSFIKKYKGTPYDPDPSTQDETDDHSRKP